MIGGHIDEADGEQVRGWVRDASLGAERPILDLFCDGKFVGQALANMFRPDLKASGIGDGFHGFHWRSLTPDHVEKPGCVEIRIPQLGRRWMRRRAPTSPISRDLYSDVASYLRATVGRLRDPGKSVRRSILHDQGRHAFDKLFEESTLDGRPLCHGRHVSEYLAYSLYRHGIETRYDTTLSEARYESALHWHLTTYSCSRPSFRIPMAARDIAWLNESCVTLPARNRFERMFAPTFDGEERYRAVDWGIYNPAALAMDDCIEGPGLERVTPDDLSGHVDLKAQTLGLRLWLDRHPVLRRLPTSTPENIREACVVLMLFAPVLPSLLRLISPDAVKNLTQNSDGEPSTFDRVCQRWLGPAAITIDTWRTLLTERGLHPVSLKMQSVTARGDRLEAARQSVISAPLVDIQIIGPFSRSLGVGQSCRRLASVVAATGYTVRFCDFTLDYVSRTLPNHGFCLEAPGPARLNIIHLNFEELPKSFAYLPDVFTGAVNVAFPYTELSQLAREQALGCELVDHIWAATSHIAGVVGGRKPVSVIGSYLEPMKSVDRAAARARLLGASVGKNDFMALTTCDTLSGFHRKNPIASIRAFVSAFPSNPNARLVVKTHSLDRIVDMQEVALWHSIREVAEQDHRIIILEKYMDADDYVELLGSADALLSLHRSEGLGYNILEAMSLGVVCIVTDYSGTRDICNEDTSLLVSGRMVPILPGQYPFSRGEQVWAEPDHNEAVLALRRAALDPELRERLAKRAQAAVQERFGFDAVRARLTAEIVTLIGGPADQGE
jgi:glycosyltransferase involved in cell wall biosynthesis